MRKAQQETKHLLDLIDALKRDNSRIESELDVLREELRAEEKENENLTDRNEALCALLRQAMEHVPAVAVDGIDQRAIEEAIRC